MTTDSLKNSLARLLDLRVSVVFQVLSLIVFSCSTKKTNHDFISRSDSVKITQKVLDDSSLVTRLKNEFREKQLKLIIGKNIHSNSKLLFDNQVVSIVPYDSTTDEIRAKFPGKFFGQVPMFMLLPEGTIKVSVVFRGSGLTGLFELQKGQMGWSVVSRQFGRI